MRALSPSLRHALPFADLALVGCSSEEPLVDATPALGTTAPSATTARAAPSPNEVIAIAWLPAPVARFRGQLEAMGRRHGIDPELLAIVTLVESGGWAAARSPSGARGLMQVMPRTGAIIAEERSIAEFATEQLDEPATNLDFGAYYLAQQLRRFATPDPDESVERAAAAYNGGPTHLERHLAGAALADQTQRYRTWVGSMWRERRLPRSAGLSAWLDAGGARLLARGAEEMVAKVNEGAVNP